MRSRTATPLVILRPSAPERGVEAIGDAELVRRALAHDEWAKAAIYRRYASQIGNIAARLLGNRADVMDVLQDVFMEAFSELATLRDPSALRPWLVRRTVNKVHKRFRRRKLLRLLGLDRGADELTLFSLRSPDCSPEDRLELARISEVLASLPARQRIAWVLHRVEGETLPAVADATGRSLATVKRDIAAAQRAIDAHVRPINLVPKERP